MNCDKCGLPVTPNNDATIIEAYAFNSPFTMFFNQSRHFLPVIDESGKIICEGSPSRAQYIKGQKRDTRGYVYNPKHEKQWRTAYKRVQLEYKKEEN